MLTEEQNKSLELCISKQITPPRKINKCRDIRESGLVVERLLTDGLELTFCGQPGRKSSRSILHAACFEFTEEAPVKKWRIDVEFTRETMSDLEHFYSRMKNMKNNLIPADPSDHIMHTRPCSRWSNDEDYKPGMCTRRIDFDHENLGAEE